ncbi:MAG TPA: ferrichrome ABC transporter permease, partial [Clostridiales bacterium]|nr:ferrichrome ABC transporter permease [Clostridiales bacterium]
MNAHNKSVQTKHKYNSRILPALMIILIGPAILFLLMSFSVTKGAAQVPINAVWDAFFNFNPDNTQHLIIIDLRL